MEVAFDGGAGGGIILQKSKKTTQEFETGNYTTIYINRIDSKRV